MRNHLSVSISLSGVLGGDGSVGLGEVLELTLLAVLLR
jgi:hypothetical protein